MQVVLSREKSHVYNEALSDLPEDHDDVSLLEQYHEQLADYKKELASVYEELAALDLDDSDEFVVLHTKLEKLWFDCSHEMNKLLSMHVNVDGKGVRHPKLDVPTFNGDVLQWKQFSFPFLCVIAAISLVQRSLSIYSRLSRMVQQEIQLKGCPGREIVMRQLNT